MTLVHFMGFSLNQANIENSLAHAKWIFTGGHDLPWADCPYGKIFDIIEL